MRQSSPHRPDLAVVSPGGGSLTQWEVQAVAGESPTNEAIQSSRTGITLAVHGKSRWGLTHPVGGPGGGWREPKTKQPNKHSLRGGRPHTNLLTKPMEEGRESGECLVPVL